MRSADRTGVARRLGGLGLLHLSRLLVAATMAAGCGRGASPAPRPSAPIAAESGPLDEAGVLAIARRAVATNEDWLEQAVFDPPRRDGSGWSVLVRESPAAPGGHRLIRIDRDGKILQYLRGS